MDRSIGWGTSQNRVTDDGAKLIIEIETFDFGMSEAHQNLAKWRALKAATRAIDEVARMPQEEVDRVWKEIAYPMEA